MLINSIIQPSCIHPPNTPCPTRPRPAVPTNDNGGIVPPWLQDGEYHILPVPFPAPTVAPATV